MKLLTMLAACASATVLALACARSDSAAAAPATAGTAVRKASIGAPFPSFPAESVAKLTSANTAKPGTLTVYMTLGVHCPATPRYTERVKELERAYKPKGVEFIYIYPNVTESAADKQKFHADSGYVGAMIDDEGARIAKLLECKKTSEAFVVAKDGTLVYRGGVDDNLNATEVHQKFLATALDELLANKPVTTKSGPVFG